MDLAFIAALMVRYSASPQYPSLGVRAFILKKDDMIHVFIWYLQDSQRSQGLWRAL